MKSGSTREKDDASFSLSRDVCYIMSKSGREIFSCLLLSVFREFLQMNCNVIESLWSCWRNRIEKEKERVPLPKFSQLVGYCRHRRFCCRWAIESCWLLVIAAFLRILEWFPSISLAIKSFGGLNEWEEERILAQSSREKNHKSDSDLHSQWSKRFVLFCEKRMNWNRFLILDRSSFVFFLYSQRILSYPQRDDTFPVQWIRWWRLRRCVYNLGNIENVYSMS